MVALARKGFKRLARLGYLARGVVYAIIGAMALLAAFGRGGGTTDSQGALLKILEQPFGRSLLVLMIVGLFGYSLWRFVQATQDPDRHGSSFKGLAVRGGLLVSSITHIGLAVWAARLLIGSGINGSTQDQAQGLLATPAGQLALGIAGAAVVGAGLAHIYKAWSGHFVDYMTIPRDQQSWAQPVCRFGLLARGIVWLIIGGFLINSALEAYHDGVAGMAEALTLLRDSSYGPWLLVLVAAGLFAFGVYSVLEAFYRRIEAPDI